MKAIVACTHGILTGQTNPGWPDKFEAWVYHRDPDIHIVKRLYTAGPFPRWNNWVKNPQLAHGLANEIEPLAGNQIPIWMIAHSNGGPITLLAAKELIARGCKLAGLILTGAAIQADVQSNGILDWINHGKLGLAIAYSSQDDAVVAGDPNAPTEWYWKCRDWAWGKLMWPYGSLGRTGWLENEKPFRASPRIFTRWFNGGHSCYFAPDQIESTFSQFLQDMTSSLVKSILPVIGTVRTESLPSLTKPQ